MNAFSMVHEGIAFLERTMPLGARFPEGKIFREDRFPVPIDALREILLNAVMHRDYSNYSGYVAIVVFDDRIEIRSFGRLPNGITVEQLSGRHDSKPTNPLIAEAFHRTGAVEVWGRGTNRVISMFKKYGIAPPVFEERHGFLVVTFKAQMVRAEEIKASGVESGVELRGESRPESDTTSRIIYILQHTPKSRNEIALSLGHKSISGAMKKAMTNLLSEGLIVYTMPNKPNSRFQKYRLTTKGQSHIKKTMEETGANEE